MESDLLKPCSVLFPLRLAEVEVSCAEDLQNFCSNLPRVKRGWALGFWQREGCAGVSGRRRTPGLRRRGASLRGSFGLRRLLRHRGIPLRSFIFRTPRSSALGFFWGCLSRLCHYFFHCRSFFNRDFFDYIRHFFSVLFLIITRPLYSLINIGKHNTERNRHPVRIHHLSIDVDELKPKL